VNAEAAQSIGWLTQLVLLTESSRSSRSVDHLTGFRLVSAMSVFRNYPHSTSIGRLEEVRLQRVLFAVQLVRNLAPTPK
jgi:ABC-type dipeptide/oligopeptide/nickel transport system ATPase component